MKLEPAEVAPDVRFVRPKADVRTRVRDLLRYRELLLELVRKELKVKYKNSVLGFLWSLLNPALYLAIFWIVFTKFLGNQMPDFPVYFLAGLLGWNLLANSLNTSVGSLVGNASLVTKVYFPREILPIASIGASLVHFFLQLLILVAAVVGFRIQVTKGLLLLPPALLTEVLFLVGVCLIVSVLNVYFRDVQHLLEIVMLAWFWMTPIVVPIAQIQSRLSNDVLWRIYLLNPATAFVVSFQRGVYGQVSPRGPDGRPIPVLVDAPLGWYFSRLGFVAAGSVVLIAIGWTIFRRLESRLAEEL